MCFAIMRAPSLPVPVFVSIDCTTLFPAAWPSTQVMQGESCRFLTLSHEARDIRPFSFPSQNSLFRSAHHIHWILTDRYTYSLLLSTQAACYFLTLYQAHPAVTFRQWRARPTYCSKYCSKLMSGNVFLLLVGIPLLSFGRTCRAVGDGRRFFLQSCESRFSIPVPRCVGTE